MSYVTLAFTHDKDDWISNIISWFTFGEYTHVAIVNGTELIESTGKGNPSGVILSSIDDFIKKHKDVVFRKIEHPNPMYVWYKAKSQVGKKYNWWWILGYLLHSDKFSNNTKWSCSELVAWALGEEIIPKKYLWFVHPQTMFILSKEV
jgi:hypothetical protein